MFIEPVKSGQALSAVKENQKIAAITSLQEQINTLYTPYPVNPVGLVVTAKNSTGGTVKTGQAVNISDITLTNKPKETIIKNYLNFGITVTASSLSSTSMITGFALESAKPNKLFKAVILGVAGALVTFSNTAHGYANTGTNGLKSAPFGEFKIIGSSNESVASGESSVQRFCIVAPIKLGHLIGTLSGTIQGQSGSGARSNVVIDQNLTIENVGCPLLRSTESITSGSKVVLSWNSLTKEFQIVEAQCPEGSGN